MVLRLGEVLRRKRRFLHFHILSQFPSWYLSESQGWLVLSIDSNIRCMLLSFFALPYCFSFQVFKLGPFRAGWLPGIKDASKRLYSSRQGSFYSSKQALLKDRRRCRKLLFKVETKREDVIIEMESKHNFKCNSMY